MPLTADDLLRIAHEHGFTQVSRRLITDWIEIGMLCSPEFQKGSRHGSSQRTFPHLQGQHFINVLRARRDIPVAPRDRRNRILGRVVYMWLLGIVGCPVDIPTEQARRALKTLSSKQLRLPLKAIQKDVAGVVDDLTHPNATPTQVRKAKLVLDSAMSRTPVRWDLVESVLGEVFAPLTADGRRPQRALTIGGRPAGVPEYVAGLQAIHRTLIALAAGQVSSEQLEEARCLYGRRFGHRAFVGANHMLVTLPSATDAPDREVETFHLVLSDLVGGSTVKIFP
ncbi:hypothetical protein [Streptomyces sp. NBC_00572]|uniref:hypothetical protein n=1 Tax=Streptomyces sp. NBC_00572 TaxID=2903664 RepID=UPI00224E3475|nr:hypothetical protein [Streptomyces sp. NBC_00572]MCX4987034.1 hypothetical protein [Streptomyces sp. NBC_00572]